ncbi:MAG: hypothetical protein KG012_04290 [Deltaproteobacteria bacterium]|nr:hypothetical protein [Deltaproteobacteria bacterium]
MAEYIKFSKDFTKLARKLSVDVRAAKRAGMLNVVETIEAGSVKEAPVKTSDLVNTITSEVASDGSRGKVKATAGHAKYVHEGTGLYGPRKTKIVPKEKKALFWEGARHPVRSVKGMKPNPFMTRARKGLKLQVLFEEGVRGYLKRR